MAKPEPSSRDKGRAYRAPLREQGLRYVRLRVADVRSPAFKAEAARQARLVAHDPHEAEIMAFVEAVADWGAGE